MFFTDSVEPILPLSHQGEKNDSKGVISYSYSSLTKIGGHSLSKDIVGVPSIQLLRENNNNKNRRLDLDYLRDCCDVEDNNRNKTNSELMSSHDTTNANAPTNAGNSLAKNSIPRGVHPDVDIGSLSHSQSHWNEQKAYYSDASSVIIGERWNNKDAAAAAISTTSNSNEQSQAGGIIMDTRKREKHDTASIIHNPSTTSSSSQMVVNRKPESFLLDAAASNNSQNSHTLLSSAHLPLGLTNSLPQQAFYQNSPRNQDHQIVVETALQQQKWHYQRSSGDSIPFTTKNWNTKNANIHKHDNNNNNNNGNNSNNNNNNNNNSNRLQAPLPEVREETSPSLPPSVNPGTKSHHQQQQQQQHPSHNLLPPTLFSQQTNNNTQNLRSRPHYNLQPRASNYQHPRHGNNQPSGWIQATHISRGSSQANNQAGLSPVTYPRHHSQPSSPPSSITPSSRTPPEVLKTLLRKKACLYEPGTSRAIALITWLVGRSLALHHGYFSRQHLQAGVHSVVAEKISSGIITRTKVNRCMQIILNSCFHYIIPRPDGTEERGDTFQKLFQQTVIDDTHLLKSLPHPWSDLESNLKSLIENDIGTSAWVDEVNEIDHSIPSKKMPDNKDLCSTSSRRPVLLCFNENVRSAEDVLSCHNEFIRDAAISANLLLTADEWRVFFVASDDDDGSHSHITDGTVESTLSGGGITNSPLIRTSEGCDIPYISFEIPADVSSFLSLKEQLPDPWAKKNDSLGQMNPSELAKFRTTWCCKRYEHDHNLCRFAHAEINKGWLRRDPMNYEYSDTMCPNTSKITDENSVLHGCHLNACPEGNKCRFAHSKEEIDYHPKQYKSCSCESVLKKSAFNNCKLRDICPFLHPENHHHLSPKGMLRSPLRNNSKRSFDNHPRGKGMNITSGKHIGNMMSGNVSTVIPEGTPIIYLNPAPKSNYEKSLMLPGLKDLYRRNCASHYVSHFGFTQKDCCYNNFGDDWGLPRASTNFDKAGKHNFSLYST